MRREAKTQAKPNESAELICSYTRADAIRDGVLIDVTDMAAEAGIRLPVALTQAVWNEYVHVPHGASWQDESGRLWDILWMLRYGISQSGKGEREILFSLCVQNGAGRESIKLKAVCHPGDSGEPVITIMLPDED